MTPRHLFRKATPACLVSLLFLSAMPARAVDLKWDIARTTVPENIAELKALQDTVKHVVEKCSPCTVGILIGMSAGSGVIVNEDGLVLTAAHVSGEPGRDCTLILPNGKRVRGKTLGTNDKIDSGMIQIVEKGPNDGKWPFIRLGKSGNLKKGQWVVCLGHPGGWKRDRLPVARLGQVQDSTQSLIRTNCTLVGGDSGGPLFDLDGRVIGIHSRIGYTLASNIHVPADAFQTDWTALVASEKVGKPRVAKVVLGVVFPEDEKAEPKLSDISDDGPAAKAGLKIGDVITRFDGTAVSSTKKVREMLLKYKPGDKVEVTVQRGSDTLTMTITLAKRAT